LASFGFALDKFLLQGEEFTNFVKKKAAQNLRGFLFGIFSLGINARAHYANHRSTRLVLPNRRSAKAFALFSLAFE
jgi:hypothetical protein